MLRAVNPFVLATIAALLAMGYAADANATVLNLQAAKQRTRVETWKRCRDDEIFSRGLWECWETRPGQPKKPNVHIWGCVYRSLSFRKASCEAEYLLVQISGRSFLHCYGRAYWRGSGNKIRQAGRFKIDCVDALQG